MNLDFINSIPESDRPKTVFHTDASDVVVVKDPHELINSKEMSEYDYFTCRDSIPLVDFGYLRLHKTLNWDSELMFQLNMDDWWLINMGVVVILDRGPEVVVAYFGKISALRFAMRQSLVAIPGHQ